MIQGYIYADADGFIRGCTVAARYPTNDFTRAYLYAARGDSVVYLQKGTEIRFVSLSDPDWALQEIKAFLDRHGEDFAEFATKYLSDLIDRATSKALGVEHDRQESRACSGAQTDR